MFSDKSSRKAENENYGKFQIPVNFNFLFPCDGVTINATELWWKHIKKKHQVKKSDWAAAAK